MQPTTYYFLKQYTRIFISYYQNAPQGAFSYSPKSAFLRAAGFIAFSSSILFFAASRFGVFLERDFFILPTPVRRFAIFFYYVITFLLQRTDFMRTRLMSIC